MDGITDKSKGFKINRIINTNLNKLNNSPSIKKSRFINKETFFPEVMQESMEFLCHKEEPEFILLYQMNLIP
jgi:hypothetical protein